MPIRRLLCSISVGLLLAGAVKAEPPRLQGGRQYPSELLRSQYESLRAMGAVDVEYRRDGRVAKVWGKTGLRAAAWQQLEPGDSATQLLRALQPILMATGKEALIVRDVIGSIPGGGSAVFMNQLIDGIPVIDGGVNVWLAGNSEIERIASRFVAVVAPPPKPIVSVKSARSKAAKELTGSASGKISNIRVSQEDRLVYWTDEGNKEPIPVWLIDATYEMPDGMPTSVTIVVDALSGDVMGERQRSFSLHRWMLSANHDFGPDVSPPSVAVRN